MGFRPSKIQRKIPVIASLVDGLLYFTFFHFLLRGWFLFLNRSSFSEVSVSDVLTGLFWGLRFDFSSASFLIAPWILIFAFFSFLDSIFKRKTKAIDSGHHLYRHYVLGFTLVVAALNLADSCYYPFSGRRSDLSVFELGRDFVDQSGQLAFQYVSVIISGLVFTLLCLRLVHRSLISKHRFLKDLNHKANPTQVEGKIFYSVFCGFVLFVCTGIGIRGGFQEKPLTPVHAYALGTSDLAALQLNTTFTFLKSEQGQVLAKATDITPSKARQILLDHRSSAFELQVSATDNFKPFKHVIVVVMESLSAEHLSASENGRKILPRLNKLLEKSLFFPNFFANGRRSIDAVPAIVYSLPNFLSKAFINTRYRSNSYRSIPLALAPLGFDSRFYHGGKNGTMYFDVMAFKAGFNKYVGMNEYPLKEHFDGAWGIYDHYFMQFSLKDLAARIQNGSHHTFSTIFTLSSHNPYSIPGTYEEKFKGIKDPFLKSLRYADEALFEMLEGLESFDWSNDTVVLITGDHTAHLKSSKYNNEIGRYQVPLILYSPRKVARLIGTDYRLGSHVDMAPTIFELVGKKEENLWNPAARSLLLGSKMEPVNISGEVFVRSGKRFLLLNKTGLYVKSTDSNEVKKEPWTFTGEPLLAGSLSRRERGHSEQDMEMTQSEQLLKAHISYYHGLFSGSMEVFTGENHDQETERGKE